jgi:elongation factor Tu
VLAAQGSIVPRRRCRAELYLLAAREGGRSTAIRSGYRPQLYVGPVDVTARVALAAAAAELTPGTHAEIELELDRPIALEAGVRFALREGGRTIGAGVVTTLM